MVTIVRVHRYTIVLQLNLQNRLPRIMEEEVIGEASVIKTFKLTGSRAATVAGCRVKKGQMIKEGIYRLLRDDEVHTSTTSNVVELLSQVIHEGRLSGMMRDKEEIVVAKRETECGLSFTAGNVGCQEGDWVVCFKKNMVPQSLDWELGF